MAGRRQRKEAPDRSKRGPEAAHSDDPESVARSVALQRLSAAPQTRAQLDRAMAGKGVPEDVRARVLDRFSDVNLIDDAAFAAAWVESRHAGRGLARRALGHELRQRGVEAHVAAEALAALPAEREEEMARELVVKRLGGTRGLDPAVRSRRLIGMLGRKGYPAGLAYRVVREMLEAEGADTAVLPDEFPEE
ncbi:regulatory protein RecX [Phytoactinopolyspora limicola]|uniref:regulatory protein RecX n=1 Tax=Phytoactinopolyspora limicola TaxID=2715536 RepID=UPI00140C3B7A|nr:regulatory protein RecX [Phytoactinopolyspora limicola]